MKALQISKSEQGLQSNHRQPTSYCLHLLLRVAITVFFSFPGTEAARLDITGQVTKQLLLGNAGHYDLSASSAGILNS